MLMISASVLDVDNPDRTSVKSSRYDSFHCRYGKDCRYECRCKNGAKCDPTSGQVLLSSLLSWWAMMRDDDGPDNDYGRLNQKFQMMMMTNGNDTVLIAARWVRPYNHSVHVSFFRYHRHHHLHDDDHHHLHDDDDRHGCPQIIIFIILFTTGGLMPSSCTFWNSLSVLGIFLHQSFVFSFISQM